jgi:hypothetical protein
MASSSPSSEQHVQVHDPVDPAEALRGTPIIVASFTSAQEFLDRYRGAGDGALELATRARPRPGSEAVVEIQWPGIPNRVFMRARVARHSRDGVVARLHRDERPARDFLLQLARGEVPSWHPRRYRRYCVRLPLGWRSFGSTTMLEGVAHDLSAGGALVTTAAPTPPVGEGVALRLHVSGLDLIVTGTVRHRRERSDDHAFGVHFTHGSTGEQQRLRRLLRTFAARGVVILAE